MVDRFVGWVLLVIGASSALGTPTRADDPATIGQTQLQVRLENRQFQATAIARDGDLVTLLTAAHCLGPDDAGAPLWVRQVDEGLLQGEVMTVTWNPAYEGIDPGDGEVTRGLGIDSAIATIRIKPVGVTEAARLLAIRPADLAPSQVLSAGRKIVTIHVVDQHGREHVLRAGNHLNPKCLAWGGGYRPEQGDSGSGVFLQVPGPEGRERPLLVGNVAFLDDRGGIAPLISRRDPWVGLGPAPAPPPKPDSP